MSFNILPIILKIIIFSRFSILKKGEQDLSNLFSDLNINSEAHEVICDVDVHILNSGIFWPRSYFKISFSLACRPCAVAHAFYYVLLR